MQNSGKSVVFPAMALTRRVMVFATVLIALVQFLAIALSEAGVRLNRPGCLVALASALSLATAADLRVRPKAKEVLGHESWRGNAPLLLPDRICWIALLVFVLLMGMLGLAAYRQGDLSYDGNAYHIPAVNQWAVSERICEVNPGLAASPYANGYPKGAEAVAFVVAQAFGSGLLGILNFAYAPLGLLGVSLLCQLFGAGVRDSLVFGACFLLIPANLYQYGSTYVDTAFACGTIALLALLSFDLLDDERCRFGQHLAVGCAMGNIVAIKSTGPLIVAASVFAYLICSILLSRRARASRPLSQRCGGMAISLMLAAAVGGFWYARNYSHHGNPLYPVQVSVAGQTILPGVPLAAVFKDDIPAALLRVHPLLRLLISWLIPLLRLKAWYHQVELGSFGVFWLLACIPAVWFCGWYLGRGRFLNARQRMVYGFLAGSVAASLLGTPLSFRSRLTVWVFALGMPSVCIALAAAQTSGSRLRLLLRRWATACVALLLAQAVILGAQEGFALVKYTPSGGPVTARFALREKHLLPLYPEMDSKLLAAIMSSNRAIAVGPEGDLGHERRIYGQLAEPLGRHNLIPIPSSVTASDLDGLRSSVNLEYVLWLSSLPVPPALAQRADTVETHTPFTLLRLSSSTNTPTRQSRTKESSKN